MTPFQTGSGRKVQPELPAVYWRKQLPPIIFQICRKNDVTYRGATLRPKYGLWLARFNTPSRQMMPPAVLSPVSMAMTVPPIIKEMMEKIFPPGPSMTYRQVRQKSKIHSQHKPGCHRHTISQCSHHKTAPFVLYFNP